MTIDYSFNVSQNITAPDNTLWAMRPNRMIQFISADNVMLIHPDSQKIQLMMANMLPVLDMLDSFHTLSQHVKHIAQALDMPASAQAQIRQFIEQLREGDFLLSSDEVGELVQSGQDNFTTEPPLVVIRTAGRVEMFKRFLLSAVENEVRYFGKYHYVVIDDSPSHQAEANLKNLTESELRFSHFDKTRREHILSQLKQAFPGKSDDLDFLLGTHALHADEKPYGRTWNWGMLLTAGKSVVLLDDDCMALAFEPPVTHVADSILTHQNKSVYFLQKKLPLGEQLQTAKIDPIARLGGALGQSLNQINIENSLHGVHAKDIATITAHSTAIMTSQAVAGDTGSDSLLWLYNLDTESTARLMGDDEATYKQKKRERFMWTGYPATKISFGDNFSQVARGIDNRTLVPAALPVGRNEDSLFTQMLHTMYPTRFSLDHAWAITHLPEIEREWQDEQLDTAAQFSLDTAMRAELTEFRSASTSADTRLTQLVSHLAQRFSGADFDQFMYQHQQESRASMLRLAHEQLATYPKAPSWWTRDVERFMNANLPTEATLVAPKRPEMQAFCLTFLSAQATWVTLWQYGAEHREQWFD